MQKGFRGDALLSVTLIGSLFLCLLAIGLPIMSHEGLYYPKWVAALIGFGIAGLAVSYFAWEGKGVVGDTLPVAFTVTLLFLVLWSVFVRQTGAHSG